MAYEALERAVVGLPDDKVNQLIDFALFLKQESQRRQRQHTNTTSNFALDHAVQENQAVQVSQEGQASKAADGNEVKIEGSVAFDTEKSKNLTLLSEIMDFQKTEDDDYVSEKVIDNTLNIVFHLVKQPEIFKTGRNSLHLQFELEDRSYMEIEVFETRVTCMVVPKRVYEDAQFPDVSLDNMEQINKIVREFYGTV